MAQTETIDNDVCRMLASLAAAYGVRHVVVSPGTRSAPLAVTFHRAERFCMHTVIDERCAAFMALGMALKTDSPVLMICTSGSALMNYGPALAEAYYRRVPLIAITADRPARWIDQLDSQTMRQAGALAAVVRKSVDIPVAADTDTALFTKADLEVCDAFEDALGSRTHQRAARHTAHPSDRQRTVQQGPAHKSDPAARFPRRLRRYKRENTR